MKAALPAPGAAQVWVDGAWTPSTKAGVALHRVGGLASPSLAESLCVAQGRPLFLAAHLVRLAEGCRALAWPDPDRKALAAVALQAPIRNRIRKGGLRLRWWGGLVKPLLLAHTVPAAPAPPPGGLRLMTSVVRHYGADSLNGRAKVGHMLPNWLVLSEIEAFAEDGLRLTPEGLVAEGVWSNVFALKRGLVRTPPLSMGILEGVTRARFMEQLRRKGRTVREEPLTRYDLWTAERVWLTSSLRGLIEVRSVDGRELGNSTMRAKNRF